MSRFNRWAGLLVALAFILPASAADDKKDADKKADAKAEAAKKQAEAKQKSKMLTAGKVTGKLTTVEGSSKNFTVQITYKVGVPNAGALQNIENYKIQAAQVQLDPNRSAQDKLNALRSIQIEILKNQANAITYKDEAANLDFVAADDMKVRVANPPVEFDDKGKPKKYTAKELKELKGPGNYPGYPGEFENLKVGQYVSVYLPKTKETARPKAKDKDKDIPADTRHAAIMVVVELEPKK